MGWLKGLLGGVYEGPKDFALPLPADILAAAQRVRGQTDEARLVEARRLGPLVSQMLAEARRHVAPGVTTEAIARGLAAASVAQGTLPAMFGYRGFPALAAVSVNDEIVHGLPGPRRLEAGDLVKLEFSIVSGVSFASQSWTFVAGSPREQDLELLRAGPRALRAALGVLKHQCRIGDIGEAIQTNVEAAGLTVVRDFGGYAMGRERIEEPLIKGYGKAGFGRRLEAGRVLHLHVILKQGSFELKVLENGWSAVGLDGGRAGLFTCMVELTDDGHRLLTPLLDA